MTMPSSFSEYNLFILFIRTMRELSSGPEAHLFRTPGSPLAERIHPVRCSTRAFSPSGARGERQG